MSAKRSPRDRRCYNTPPAEYQFAKGKSGNPGGRRKGSRNFHTLLAQIADSEMQMRRDGRTVTVTVAEAVIWKQIQEALNGDPRALQACLDRLERLVPPSRSPRTTPPRP